MPPTTLSSSAMMPSITLILPSSLSAMYNSVAPAKETLSKFKLPLLGAVFATVVL